jgi:hypothetical protein
MRKIVLITILFAALFTGVLATAAPMLASGETPTVELMQKKLQEVKAALDNAMTVDFECKKPLVEAAMPREVFEAMITNILDQRQPNHGLTMEQESQMMRALKMRHDADTSVACRATDVVGRIRALF